MDLAGPDQALHEAIGMGANFSIEYVGVEEQPVTSAGLKLAEQKHYSELRLRKGDFLFLPGAEFNYLQSSEFKSKKDLFDWIRYQYRLKVNIVSICTGTFILAESGILDGKMCTTHFKRTEDIQRLYPKVKVKENILFTEDENVYTSAGIATGIDLTLYLIEKIKGSYFSHKVARELLIYTRRDGQSRQHSVFMDYRNHIHSGIHLAQDYIIDNIHRKMNLSELSKIAAMSERNFTRIFKKETLVTVNEYINLVRREKIQTLLKNPNLSRREVANQVGLESERQMHRILTGHVIEMAE